MSKEFNILSLCTFKSNSKTNENLLEKKMSPTNSLHCEKIDAANTQENKPSSTISIKTETKAKAMNNNLNLLSGKENHRFIDKSNNCFELGLNQESMDGTDSGVEVVRAMSSNGSNSDRFTPIQSCGSSLLSYSSEPEVDRASECGSESSDKSRLVNESDGSKRRSSSCWKSKKTYVKTDRSRMSNRKTHTYEGEGTSESCSETSSTHEVVTPDQPNRSLDFKRSVSNRLQEGRKCENSKTNFTRRSDSTTRNSSSEKNNGKSHSVVRSLSAARVSSVSKSLFSNRNSKPSTTVKIDVKGSKKQEDRWSNTQKTQTNVTRLKVSCGADSSRKNGIASKSINMTSSSFNEETLKSSEVKSNALEKYGTLPRRPKKKNMESVGVLAMTSSLSRSCSVSREPSLNRAATLRRQQSKEKETVSNCKTLPPYPKFKRGTGKIVIYHEVSVQTVITGEDIKTNSPGISLVSKSTELVEKESRGIQTEGKERLKKIENNYLKQCEELEKAKKENEELKLEKDAIISKISRLLGYPKSNKEKLQGNELEELEQHFQAVGLTVIKQQEELMELRQYKRIAHRDLEKSLAAQKNLLQQQQEIEEEYSELQEFLQAEKSALSESLLDTEEELTRLRTEVAEKKSLLEQQQEECKHLVRICEQRRQENLSLEAKLAGLDQRSRDILVQQGAAVSAAAVALSGLGARLDSLVEQLSVSCSITDRDLEEAVYHNEAFSQSEDNSPDDPPSQTQESECTNRGESLLQIILGAIKSAAQTPFASGKKNERKFSDQNSEVFFDTESDACLNFETVLEENSSSLSVSTDCGSFSSKPEPKKEESTPLAECESGLSRGNSLQNLSDAILNRQMIEKNEKYVSLDEIIPIEVNSLVDQIIDVDNLVTKLLKVIKIIQEESERCVEELQEERKNLTRQFYQEKLNRQNLENNFQQLQKELLEARSQLNIRITQLEEVKALCGENQRVAVVEMQKRFTIIDTALGALNSVQDVLHSCPPLAKLRKDLEDCNYQTIPGSDVNANSASDGKGLLEDVERKGTVLTTAI